MHAKGVTWLVVGKRDGRSSHFASHKRSPLGSCVKLPGEDSVVLAEGQMAPGGGTYGRRLRAWESTGPQSLGSSETCFGGKAGLPFAPREWRVHDE